MNGDIGALIEVLIERYGLRPLPVEGTLYASTWVSDVTFEDGLPVGTAIIGLHTAQPPSRSLFHRLSSDEVWHFYGGDPIRLVLLHADGTDEEVVLGGDVQAGQLVQAVVPAGTWQAGELVDGGRYALFGCTMAPGFTGAAFEGGTVARLVAAYPTRRSDIERLGLRDGDDHALPDGFTQ